MTTTKFSINDICSFEAVTLFNDEVPALICDTRISAENLTDEYDVFNLRGSDNDPGIPATIERNVSVNWCGAVITLKSDNVADKFKDSDFINIKDDINYAADFTSFGKHFTDNGEDWIYNG